MVFTLNWVVPTYCIGVKYIFLWYTIQLKNKLYVMKVCWKSADIKLGHCEPYV